jgi:type I restriction enzyme S subunit
MMKEGWEYKKLGEVAIITMGQSPSSDSYNKEENGLPFFQGCSDFGVLHPTIKTYCSAPNKIAEPLDVLMSVRAPVGTLNIADVRCCIGRGLASIRQIQNTSIYKFLYYFLQSSQDDLQAKSTGATFKAIGKELIFNYPIELPSISEQQQIVSELDLLSEAIEKLKAQLEELDILAQSIFFDMFGGKEWEKKRIKDIATVKIGPFGSALHQHDYVSGGTPLVNPIHMANGKIIADNDFTIDDNKKKELSAYLLKENDIIFGRRGDIGRCALVTNKEDGYLCGTGSLFVRFNIEISPIYSLIQLSSNETKQYLIDNARGATMLNLNSGVVEGISIPLPPLSLQREFAAKVEAIESMKAKVRQSLSEAETLFNSRMDYYFN